MTVVNVVPNPPMFEGVIVYVVAGESADGVPLNTPAEEKEIPAGSSGEMTNVGAGVDGTQFRIQVVPVIGAVL